MNSRTCVPLGLLCGLLVITGGRAAHADLFTSTLSLDSPIGTPAVDTIVQTWSTNLTSGTVYAPDLIDWSYELRHGASLVYSETVVSSGTIQPIGGATRNLVSWSFDLDEFAADPTSGLYGFDNDFWGDQEGAATGVTYVAYNFNTVYAALVRYEDGIETSQDWAAFVQVTEAVPEPDSLILLAAGGIGLLGFRLVRRRH